MALEIPHIQEVYLVAACSGTLVGWRAVRALCIPSPFPQEISRVYYLFVALAAALGAFIPAVLAGYLGSAEHGGRSITGALLFGWLGAEYLKTLLDRTEPTGDQLAVALPAALAVSRIGCLFAHCCYGVSYDGPLALIDSGRSCFPVPLIESGFHLLFFLLNMRLTQLGLLSGQRIRLYLFSYALFRILTEPLRDAVKDLAGMSIYQWTSIGLILVIGATLLRERGANKNRRSQFRYAEES